ncbi:MAG: pyruvate synthase subunit beta [Proteobacteria bacterium]|nr:pyruvate synthase subunit beta [Pseudomonadota bacterium]
MRDLSVFASRLVTKDESFTPGHRACVGCAEALAVRQVAKAVGRNAIMVNATGCMEIIASCYPDTSWEIPWIHTLFENTAAVASGVESALKVQRRKGRIDPGRRIKVVGMGGDGATADIGIQALSGMLERGHDVLYICYDNEAYMNTGIQRSGATPYGASTTTSPAGKKSIGQQTEKKNMPEIVAAHRIPYVATACPSFPFDLMDKVKRAVAVEGPAYIHVFSVCPTGWRAASEDAVRFGRLAVQSGVFPLYEVVDGEYRLSMDFEKLVPVKDYFKGQGRFRHLTDQDVEHIQRRVEKNWNELRKKCNL